MVDAQIPINVFELGLKNGLLREPEYVITYADFLLGARLSSYCRTLRRQIRDIAAHALGL